MMGEKRFKTKYYLKSRQGVVLGVVKVNEEENVLHWNDVVDLLNELVEENEIKKEELLQKKLTNVLLAKIYVAQLSLNPHISNPYVEDSLKKEMRLLDKKIRELCGDVFNE